jgi:hypothetical protein
MIAGFAMASTHTAGVARRYAPVAFKRINQELKIDAVGITYPQHFSEEVQIPPAQHIAPGSRHPQGQHLLV